MLETTCVLESLKLLRRVGSDCYQILKTFAFHGVLNLGEEEELKWDLIWGVQVLTHLWVVVFG